MDEFEKDFVRCAACGIVESAYWAEAGEHKCGLITNPKHIIYEDMDLKIGKTRFVKLRVKKTIPVPETFKEKIKCIYTIIKGK
jgi:hypothetical protein